MFNMSELTTFLAKIGYADLCASFFPGAPRLEVWRSMEKSITDLRLRRFYRLLLIGSSVAVSEFGLEEMDALTPLIKCGVLICEGEFLRSNSLSLYMVMGYWLFFETPNVNPKIYYGDDSFGLVTRLRPMRNGQTLDLCSGPGVQSLISSAIAGKVTSVEINPYAAAIAELNRDINGIDNWEIRVGDLYDALPRQNVYDHIICNPPLLPFPGDEAYPFVGHGGVDGWAVSWRVLEKLPQFLSNNGFAQIIGTTLSDGVEPIIVDRLKGWAKCERMDCELFVIAQKELGRESEYFKGLVSTAAALNENAAPRISDLYVDMLQKYEMNALVTHYMCVRHGVGDVKIIDLYNGAANSGALWYV
ncbi:hypothetical protein CFB81_08245 [Burkholderia sp. AU28863]|uniref:methyltransferase n=1 Tax=Burkholderia sp. AU28863 TaxID=2015352 RepID=UPI000B79B538|nr:methyltransferase [Burkholderia sp. AU28863]OXI73300.1 hypothetical protein CFB81_08245 [Burkholderia sp. AU28863]